MLGAENWKIALKRYEGHAIAALLLAHQLMAIKQCLFIKAAQQPPSILVKTVFQLV